MMQEFVFCNFYARLNRVVHVYILTFSVSGGKGTKDDLKEVVARSRQSTMGLARSL